MAIQFYSDDKLEEEIQQMPRPDFIEAGAERAPFLELRSEDFELLVHALMAPRPGSDHDRATLMLAGGDKGRDVRLSQGETAVGVVQCKRTAGFTAPNAVREILKFLLMAEVEPDLIGDHKGFTYWLAVAGEPTNSTIDLFDAPRRWLALNQTKIELWIPEVARGHTTISHLDLDQITPRIFRRLLTLRYKLLRPAGLLALMAVSEGVASRFFRLRSVVDVPTARAMIEESLTAAGFPTGASLKRFSDDDCRGVGREVASAVVDRLAFFGLYKRGRTIRRNAFDAELRRFELSAALVWPVLGLSGVGKTSALVQYLERSIEGGKPALLVRASEIKAHHRDITDLLYDLPWPGALGTSTAIVARLVESWPAHSMVILLDGLNEADPGTEFLRNSWIPNTLAWLRASGARLILTCRPEAWLPLADAFPNGTAHFAGSVDTKRPEGTETPTALAPFRLQDFTTGEAAEAASAYGFAGLLNEEQFTHPFLFALAEDLDPKEFAKGIEHLEILETYVRRRVSRALGHLREPSWQSQVLKKLRDVAQTMFDRRAQGLAASEWVAHFERFAPAIDRLAEEHVILASDDGYRFQFDQVREHLQLSSLSLAQVLAELTPLPGQPANWLIDILRLNGVVKQWTLIERTRRLIRADRWGTSRAINSSMAAMTIVKAMQSFDPRIPELFDALYEATEPGRVDADAAWATAVIEAVLQYLPPDALDEVIVSAWLQRLLDRYDTCWYNDWAENVVRAIVRYLIRCPNRFDAKLAQLPAVLLREHEPGWGVRTISSTANFETYWQKEKSAQRSFGKLVASTAGGQFVQHLLDLDASRAMECLAELISDRRGSPGHHVRGRSQASLSRAAAICLYSYRDVDVAMVVAAALESDGPATQDLTEGLAISEPNMVATYCLSTLESADEEHRARCVNALWLAAQHVLTGEARTETLRFALDGLYSKSGEDLVWAMRIFCARYIKYRHALARSPSTDGLAGLVEKLRGAGDRAAMLMRAHLTVNEREDIRDEDVEYQLELDFDAALERLNEQCVSEEGLSTTSRAGIRSFLREYCLCEDGRAAKYRQLVELLHRFLDRHGERAAAQIAAFALRTTDRCGNYGSFTGEQVIDLGLLGLARRILAFNNDTVLCEASHIIWPRHPVVRSKLFETLRTSALDGERLEELVKTLWGDLRGIEEPVSDLLFALRTEGKEEAWDQGACRHLYIAFRDDRESEEQIVEFWRKLPPHRLSEISRKILLRIDNGDRIAAAAARAASLAR